MGIIKNNLLSVLEWSDESRDTMAYQFPMGNKEIMWGSSLTVRESQVAIFVNKGQIADVFGPGRHRLETSNLPFLTKALALPYGFKSPFKAELYFVNTKQFTGRKWGTINPITMKDPEFGLIRVRGFGQYAFKVTDAAAFLRECFGTNKMYTVSDVEDYIKSMIVSGISDTIVESKIPVGELSANLKEFTVTAKSVIQDDINEMGLTLTNIVIENISFPPEVEKAIDERSRVGIMSDKIGSYAQMAAADALKTAAGNQGGMTGAFIGMGVGGAVGKGMGGAFNVLQNAQDAPAPKKQAPIPEPRQEKEQPQQTVQQQGTRFCTGCGHPLEANSKFCHDCGKPQGATVCSCGAKLKADAKFCSECGKKT